MTGPRPCREDKRSFFYPSIGSSVVITDLFEQAGNDITSTNGLSFLKFRSTWAKAGKDAPIGALNSFLGTNINPLQVQHILITVLILVTLL